jgi:tetratricopeptide (TPR) repeat protein
MALAFCATAVDADARSPRLCREDEPIVGLSHCAAESEIANWPADWRADAHAGRAVTYYNGGKFDKAIGDYDRAIELAPNSLRIRMERGILRFELKQYATAVDDFTIALTINSHEGVALQCRAEALRALDRQSDAEADERSLRKVDTMGYLWGHPPCRLRH